MKLQKNNTLFMLALTLILTVSSITLTIPAVSAHTPPWKIPTWTYIITTNNPIGINQPLTFVFWLNEYPITAQGKYGDRWSFTLVVTKPDGTNDTLGPITSDPVGSAYTSYTPTTLGTYSVIAKFPGKVIDGTPNGLFPNFNTNSAGYDYINDTYLASTSTPATFVVQQQPIQSWQEPPIPTGYWTVPVNSMNRGWSSIVSNWLGGSSLSNGPTYPFGYGKAPETAHILWTKPYWAGGIMDTRFGAQNYNTFHYDGIRFTPPVIIGGKIFYDVTSYPEEGWYCLNLYTGQVEFFHNTTGPVTSTGGAFDAAGAIGGQYLSFGQIYNYNSPNQFGGFPYLWSTGPPTPFFGSTPASTTWMMFDAYTGNYICSIDNVPSWVSAGGGLFGPSATNVYGKDGSLTYYNIAGTTNPADPFAPPSPPFYLQIWNTSQVIWWAANAYAIANSQLNLPFNIGYNSYWMWRPTLNATFDGNNGYTLNVTIPAVQGSILAIRESQYVIGGTSGIRDDNGNPIPQSGNLWALSLAKGQEGKLLWNITYTPPMGFPSTVQGGIFAGGLPAGPSVDPEDNVFYFSVSMLRKWYVYDLTSGNFLWSNSVPENPWNYYGMTSTIYNGMLISTGSGMAGSTCIAYDIRTGAVKWEYVPAQVGFESPYGDYSLNVALCADGKIYLYSTEHHQIDLLWRGSYLRCLDGSSGKELWKIDDWVDGAALADGYIVTLNYYDMQIYCYGIGPSATTVTTSPVIGSSSSVLIQGSVTDQSPGAKGTPAVSDASQQAQMEYLYEQQAKPTNATGVPVTLTALDPNNNIDQIGSVTSDANGLFHITWTPPVQGEYVITATFAGSKAYGSSFAETALSVSKASGQASATPSANVAPPSSSIPAMTYVGIAAAVLIIVVAIAALILRRRK